MKIRNIRIGMRLGAGLTLVVGLAACLFAVTLAETSRSRTVTVDALSGVLQRKTVLGDSRSTLLEAAVSMRNVGLLTEVADMQREDLALKATRKRLSATLQSMADDTTDGRARELIDQLRNNETALDAPLANALQEALAFNPEGAVKIISGKIEPLYRDSLTKMNALQQLEDQRAQRIAQRSTDDATRVLKMLLAAALVTVLVAVAIGVLLTRSITRPIHRAVDIAQRVAQGDLSATIDVDRHDETGDLLEALRGMSEQLKAIVGQVRESADSIGVATEQVSAGNLDLSTRTEEAAAATQETVSAMDKLGATVQTNADHARQAIGMADVATGVASRGGEVFTAVVSTMARISDSSKKIGDIISVIDGIAFQTNILALNAAVEAARAGEQGRGFAVVASEVRALAQRSASAAREIKQLIIASVDNVDSGTTLVGKAGLTMDDILASVRGFHDIVRGVSSASDEQARGIGEIKSSMTRIDDATQRNAALVEEAAAASSSLQEQATRLRLSISRFTI